MALKKRWTHLPGKSLDNEGREQERDAQANGVGEKQEHTLPESPRIAGQENDGAGGSAFHPPDPPYRSRRRRYGWGGRDLPDLGS